MKEPGFSAPDPKLSALLRESRPSTTVPPRFAGEVWKRIERSEHTHEPGHWLTRLLSLLLQPRLAAGAALVLILAGAGLGIVNGRQSARLDAQARYLASVTPVPAP